MKIIRIDLDRFDSIKEFHLWLKKECNFPDYYGCNLDALYDCLTEDPGFEFEYEYSLKYVDYLEDLIDTIQDSGCTISRVIQCCCGNECE